MNLNTELHNSGGQKMENLGGGGLMFTIGMSRFKSQKF